MSPPRWPIPATALGGAAAGTCVWTQRGQVYATVVVKATFRLVPDAAMALSPPDPLDGDERSDPSGQGLCTGGDMAPTLTQAELWVVGHAQGVPTAERRALDIRVALARDGGFIYEKRLSLGTGGAYGSPVRLPLGALGPLSKRWPIRARRLGGLDAALLDGPRIELPERFDWEYFQTAPADQRLPALRGDEWLILEGIYLDCPRLKTYLPRVMGAARVYGRDAELRSGRPLRIGLDSLHIDVDRRCCSMLWRGYFPISPHAGLDTFHLVGGIEWPGHSPAWPNRFHGPPAEQQPIAPLPAAGSPLDSTFMASDADAQKLVKIAETLLGAKKTSLPNSPPATPLPRRDAAVLKNDAPVPSPPDSDPCVDTVQLTDSDARKLAQIAATPFEANQASLDPAPCEGTVQLSTIDAQKLAAIAALPFEANKARLPSRMPAIAAQPPRAAEANAGGRRQVDEDPMGTTLGLGDADVQKLAQAAVTPFVRGTAPPQRAPAPASVERAAPASAELDETLHVPQTLGSKQVAAAVLPFVPPSPLAPPPLLGTSATTPIPPHRPDPSRIAPPQLLGTPAPEPEHAATHAATPSQDPPATLGAFFLAAMESAAARTA